MFMMNNDKMLMQLAVLIFIFCLFFFFFSLECNCKSGRHMTFVTILHDMSLHDESFN